MLQCYFMLYIMYKGFIQYACASVYLILCMDYLVLSENRILLNALVSMDSVLCKELSYHFLNPLWLKLYLHLQGY